MRRVGELAHEKRHHLKKHVRLGVSWTLATRAVPLAARHQPDPQLPAARHEDGSFLEAAQTTRAGAAAARAFPAHVFQ